jgi:hypothetical protein
MIDWHVFDWEQLHLPRLQFPIAYISDPILHIMVQLSLVR